MWNSSCESTAFCFLYLTLIDFQYLFKNHIHWHECRGEGRNEQLVDELFPLILQTFLLIFIIHQLLTVPGYLFVCFLCFCFLHEYFTNCFLTPFPVHHCCHQGSQRWIPHQFVQNSGMDFLACTVGVTASISPLSFPLGLYCNST